MELRGSFQPEWLLWVSFTGCLFILLAVMRHGHWRWLLQNDRFNLWLGCCVVLILLWMMRAPVNDQLTFHLLGVSALTLMFGWSIAIVCGGVVLAVSAYTQGIEWYWYPVNLFTTAILPISLTQLSLLLCRTYLPKNFFIYVLVNGFLTAGLVAMVSGYLAVGVLFSTGLYTLADLQEKVTPFFPLMFMPEAFLNGWIITMLVLYRPTWIYSFSDDLYLKGK